MKIILSANRRGGFIGIVLGLLVAVIGTVVIYKLVYLMKNSKPYNPGGVMNDDTNNVTETDYLHPTNDNGVVYAWTNIVITDLPSSPSGYSVNLQYLAKVINDIPSGQIQIGNSMVEGQVFVLTNTENEYKIQFTLGPETDTDDFFSDGTPDNFRVYQYAGLPLIVTIQRSTNCCEWSDIFTNSSCGVGQVNNFTDSNAPFYHASYRIKIMSQTSQ